MKKQDTVQRLKIRFAIWYGVIFLLGYSIGYYTAAKEAAQMVLEALK